MKSQFLPKALEKIRRELLYEDIFRLYNLLKHPKKASKHWFSDVFDRLLEYDLDLLISHRDALMAQCLREYIDPRLILGEYRQ